MGKDDSSHSLLSKSEVKSSVPFPLVWGVCKILGVTCPALSFYIKIKVGRNLEKLCLTYFSALV